jgi:hypothetical protein
MEGEKEGGEVLALHDALLSAEIGMESLSLQAPRARGGSPDERERESELDTPLADLRSGRALGAGSAEGAGQQSLWQRTVGSLVLGSPYLAMSLSAEMSLLRLA